MFKKVLLHLLRILLGVEGLEEFKSAQPEPLWFPPNGVGTILLRRPGKVNAFVDSLLSEKSLFPVHHYFRGPRGSGKSIWLELIGRELVARGESVFMCRHAGYLRRLRVEDFARIGTVDKPAFLLIDEVQENTNDAMWGYLLKELNKKIVVIGAGIPTLTAASPLFSRRHHPNELMLSMEDFDEEVKLKLSSMLFEGGREVGVPVVMKENESAVLGCSSSQASLVDNIIEWALGFSGGHAYPALKLVEHLLCNHRQMCLEGKFMEVVGSSAFFESRACLEIRERAFHLDLTCSQAASDIFSSGIVDSTREKPLIDAGLWDQSKNWFRSDFLVQFLFADKPKRQVEDLDIDRLIALGFEGLDDTHFAQKDTQGRRIARYEHSIGHYFGWQLAGIKGLYVSPQHIVPRDLVSTGPRPTSDFYVNGKFDKIIELILNSARFSDTQDASLVGHYNRFLGDKGKYKKYAKKFVVVDIVTEKDVPSKLPSVYESNALAQNTLYSYVKPENALYKGSVLINRRVSSGLPAFPFPANVISNARSFSTFRIVHMNTTVGAVMKTVAGALR